MKLLTEEYLVNSFKEYYLSVYKYIFVNIQQQMQVRNLTAEEIKVYNRYLTVKNTNFNTAEEINKFIGNNTWTTSCCSICHSRVSTVIMYDTEEFNQYLCKDCLTKALAIIED